MKEKDWKIASLPTLAALQLLATACGAPPRAGANPEQQQDRPPPQTNEQSVEIDDLLDFTVPHEYFSGAIRVRKGWADHSEAEGKGVDLIWGELNNSKTWKSFMITSGGDGIACIPPRRQGEAVLIRHVINKLKITVDNYKGHLKSIFLKGLPGCDTDPKTWVEVKRGQPIGEVGSTGMDDPLLIHLHDQFNLVEGNFPYKNPDGFGVYSTFDQYPNLDFSNGNKCGQLFLYRQCLGKEIVTIVKTPPTPWPTNTPKPTATTPPSPTVRPTEISAPQPLSGPVEIQARTFALNHWLELLSKEQYVEDTRGGTKFHPQLVSGNLDRRQLAQATGSTSSIGPFAINWNLYDTRDGNITKYKGESKIDKVIVSGVNGKPSNLLPNEVKFEGTVAISSWYQFRFVREATSNLRDTQLINWFQAPFTKALPDVYSPSKNETWIVELQATSNNSSDQLTWKAKKTNAAVTRTTGTAVIFMPSKAFTAFQDEPVCMALSGRAPYCP